MKKVYLSFSFALLTIGLFAQTIHQQLSEGGKPWSFKNDQYDANIAYQNMPVINEAQLLYEDSLTALQTKPFRFAYDHMVSLNLSNSGSFIHLDNGDKVWRTGISAPNAKSINLSFQNMNLPAGCKLFVYNPSKSQMLGAFTQAQVTAEDMMLGTEIIYDDSVIVEVYIPQNAISTVSLEIWRVSHGYRDLSLQVLRAFGDSGACENNARCPAYSARDNQIRSAICLVNGGEFCSAALINNTCNNGTPYVLTANHCGASGFGSWVFRFNWESTGCTTPGSSPSTSQSISGSISRANYAGSDMRLLQMNSTPPASYAVYYAGWDRTNTAPSNLFGVHHPAGDIKKFSQSTGTAVTATYSGATCWQTGTWTDGVTEPGSSGSPIFNSAGLIVGQLYGGPSNCGCENNATCGYDYYGKVFTSWTGGGSAATRLSDWLDPTACATGATTLIGYDPNAPTVTLDASIQTITTPVNGSSSCETTYTPVVVLRNNGTTTLTSCTILYHLDAAPNSSYNWTGSLASGASVNVTLPNFTTTAGAHTYYAASSLPNGSADLNTTNDDETNSFTVTAVPAGTALPFTEGFQNATFPPTGWTLTNPDGINTWSRVTTAGGFGNSTASARMDNFSGTTDITGTLDWLTTPSLNFTSATAPITMNWSVGYARYNATYQDSMKIYVSTDCGGTWTRIFADGNTTLATAPDVTTAFVPTAAQWAAETLSLSAYAGEPSVYVRFESKSGYGNHLYLDDINIFFTPSTPPVADFSASSTSVCAGSTVTFTDLSTNTPTSWSWTFTGGTPATSTVQNPTVTYSTPGTYTVTLVATNASGSDTETKTAYITVNAAPTATATSNSPVCEGATINLSTPAVTGATYAWTGPGGYTAAIRNPSRTGATTAMSGTYTVTVTANGCTSTSSTTVTVNSLPTASATSNSPVCAGQTINLFTPTVSGATYSWTGPGGFTSTSQNPTRPSATLAMSGTYTVTVIRTGCTSTSSVVVTVNANPTSTASASNATCNGTCNGTATVTPSGGAPGYTYLWSASAGSQTTATATGLCDGTYSVTVTDANGCTSTSNATVAEPTVLAVSSVNTTQSSCSASTGSATVTATGGTTSYMFSINGGTPQASNIFTGLAAGVYNLTVTDANSCSTTSTFTITNPNAPSATSTSTPTTCVGICDGTGSVTITGGTAPFSVNWCGTSTQTGITSVATNNVLCAGTCTVTITDASGCTTTQTITITSPTALTSSMNATSVSCNGDCDGVGTVTVSGGTAPYTVSWCDGNTSSNVTTTAVNSSLCGGTCSVTITDANGCATNQSATVSEPATLSGSETHVDETVAGNDGSIDLTVNGGTGPYTFSWSNGATTEDLTGLASGSYSVTITDANGCTTIVDVVVGNSNGIEENAHTAFLIYPNPNTGMFTLDLGKAIETNVELFDAQGKLVYSSQLVNQKTDLNLPLATGIYHLRMINEDGISNHKLIIGK